MSVDDQAQSLHDFISGSRWFGGKGREFTVAQVRALPLGERTVIALVTLAFADGDSATYQLPLVLYAEPREDLQHVLVGTWHDDTFGQVHAYDALHDHEVTPDLLRAFENQDTIGPISFHRTETADLDLDARSAVLSAEQSNTSVAFGEDAMLKVFRKITPGRNPDIDIHARLTEAGSEYVAALLGWVELAGDPDSEPGSGQGGEPTHLALLQQFLRTASDGWELALTSVRDLLATADISAAEAGGDFSGEAHRLGAAVAEIHLALAATFPSEDFSGADVAAGMEERLTEAVAAAPSLAPYADGLRATFAAVAARPGVPAQRIHGDLHLGQTLRTVRGWKIVDFEGEPAKPLAERVRPDSPWRDIAGMLRSFDYAAAVVEAGGEPAEPGAHAASRAEEWAGHNRSAFLDGYREVTGLDARTGDAAALVAAFEVDKAVYEVVYETRNRPDWAHIPMGAVARIAGAA